MARARDDVWEKRKETRENDIIIVRYVNGNKHGWKVVIGKDRESGRKGLEGERK